MKLKLKVEGVPTLKRHESEPQVVSETVSKVCVVLALDNSKSFVISSERGRAFSRGKPPVN